MSAGGIIFCIIMAFCMGYLIGGKHGVAVSENMRKTAGK